MSGTVGVQRNVDNAVANVRIGNQGEIITGEMFGKHYEQLLRGNIFVYGIASQALLLAATTGGHPTVINPSGSGVIFVPLALRIGFISGTTVIGSVVLAETTSVGAGAATGAPIATATLVAARNALRGAGKVSQMLWSPTTNTFTAAPSVILPTGLNLGAAAPTGTGTYETKFDGAIGFYPGTACSVCYSVTTSTALFNVTLIGAEIPIPLTN